MKESALLLASSLAATLLFGAIVQAKEPLRFIFITCNKDEAFFGPVKQGMHDAAIAVNVHCEFTGTEGVDVKAQAELVRKAVADKYDGIALNIIDAHAFDTVIAEALDKGIPVVAFNIDAQPAASDSGKAHLATAGPPFARPPDGGANGASRRPRRLSAICQDFPKAGRTLGEMALEFVPPRSEVLLTLHDHGISALDQRLAGIQSALKTRGIQCRVLCTGPDPPQAAVRVAAELKSHPEIHCVLGTGLTDTEAAGIVIERDYPKQGYTVAGFDLSPEILRLIKAGVIRFTIDQQPYSQGYYPVVQLALYCRYGIRPCDMDAGAGIVAAGDVDRVLRLSHEHYR